MTRQSLQAVRQIFEVAQPRQIEVDTKALLIKVAKRGISEITSEQTSRAGVAPGVTVEVNGTPSKSIDQVTVPGPIVALFDYRREIAEVGLDLLRRNSPVKSGLYAQSHLILLNGSEVDQLPAKLQPGDVVTITNPVPYARRIEIGRTKAGRTFVLQVPERLYERVAKDMLLPRYGSVAKIEFNYIELGGAHITKGGLSPSYLINATRSRKSKLGPVGSQKRRLRRQKPGTAIKAPAIEIRMKRLGNANGG